MQAFIALFVAFLSVSAQAQGNNCDCQQYTAACEASINVVPTTPTKGSYGADLHIRSTAPQCSKVDYYVDGTPYFTILSQGNQGEDRVFGQKPITRGNISGVACHVCKIQPSSSIPDSIQHTEGVQIPPTKSSAKDKALEFLQGTWCSDTGSIHTVINIVGTNVTFAASYEGGTPSHNSGVLVLFDNGEFEFRRGNGTDRFSIDYGQGFRWIGRNGGAPPYPGNLSNRCAG